MFWQCLEWAKEAITWRYCEDPVQLLEQSLEATWLRRAPARNRVPEPALAGTRLRARCASATRVRSLRLALKQFYVVPCGYFAFGFRELTQCGYYASGCLCFRLGGRYALWTFFLEPPVSFAEWNARGLVQTTQHTFCLTLFAEEYSDLQSTKGTCLH